MHREIAEHPTSGLNPSRLASILRDAEHGNLMGQCYLGEDIEEKDAHVFSELQKRKMALLGRPGRVVPCRDASEQEKKDAARVQELLDELPDFDDLILNMADAVLKSFSNLELEWRSYGKEHLVAQVHYRPQSWFQLNPDDRNDIRLRDLSYQGAELQPFGWIRHVHQARSGYPGRNGLVRILAWPYLFKALSVRDLAEFLEIYGLPLRLGKYPAGASEKEKATLLQAVMSIGHNAGGIVPRSMEIEFREAAKGAADPFEAMIAWCERSQSKAILGGTLTSQADGKTSTNALGEVHNEVRQELRDSDLRQIAGTITRDLVFPLWMTNCQTAGDPRRAPRYQFDTTEPEDLAVYSQHLPNLVDLGMRIPLECAHEKLQIPAPEQGAAILARVQPQPVVGAPASLAALSANPLPKAFIDQQAIEDALAGLASGDLNEQMADVLAPLFKVAQQGPQALAERLSALWPEMSDDKLQERLAQAIFVAELWGEANG